MYEKKKKCGIYAITFKINLLISVPEIEKELLML